MMGERRSSFHKRTVQSPMVMKYLGKKGLRCRAYTGPQWPSYTMPMRSDGFFALRLHEMTLPCSVPTRNLVGPAAAEYSIETPPIVLPGSFAARSSSCSLSEGSPSLRMSHQSTWPSVDVEAHSYAFLPCSHVMSYTGSRCEFSMIDVSAGLAPLRVSQYETRPLYEPPTSKCGSLGLYSRQQSGDDGTSSCSGKLGLLTSQMYERLDIFSIRQSWNCIMAKATASFLPPSGYHEILETVRFTVFGSLKTESVLAEGGSLEWSAYSPAK
mmetsp:Transcript_26763/g.62510  ORF Transcript_26763/g.62510 Transcript_26763/m.62510 type:complete len:269 (-) Transcript_26763:463-1269(-)